MRGKIVKNDEYSNNVRFPQGDLTFKKGVNKMGKQLRKTVIIMITLVFMATFLGANLAGGSPPQTRNIIYLQDSSSEVETANKITSNGGVVIKSFQGAHHKGLVAYLPETAKKSLVNSEGVRAIEPDIVVQAIKPVKKVHKEPQPKEVLPWGVARIGANKIWDTNGNLKVDKKANAGNGVNVAIIDSGIDKNHPDLKDNIAGGINFVVEGPQGKARPGNWNDEYGHGTHVAGTCAAVDNKIGVIGVGPKIRLWTVRVLDAQGSGYLSDAIEGIYWCADKNIQVINLSIGVGKDILDQYPNDKKAFEDAVDYAYGKGIVLVAAAGNEGNPEGTGDNVDYPARFDSVIAVAATDQQDARMAVYDDYGNFWGSSTGPSVDVAAPGVDILSCFNNGYDLGYYLTASGTSMASPHIAGTAALLIASHRVRDKNHLNGIADEVRQIIRDNAVDLGSPDKDEIYGYGLVDAYRAVMFNN